MKLEKMLKLGVILVVSISLLTGCDISNRIYYDNSKIIKDYDSLNIDMIEETAGDATYSAILKLSGSATIWKYESDKDITLKAPYDLLVKSGKAKIVLISPDNKITTLIESSGESVGRKTSVFKLNIKKGYNRIKLVGYEKADIDLEIHIEKGEFQEIDF